MEVKAIEFQHTEDENKKLLDRVFLVPLTDGKTCEFLIRLETSIAPTNNLQALLQEALAKPKPHPWINDLFYYTVNGKFPMDYLKDLSGNVLLLQIA